MLKSVAQVVELCKDRAVVPLISVPRCDFFEWTRDNFPDVTILEFKRDGGDTIVEGLDGNAKKLFLFRHTRKPPLLSKEYMDMLQNENGTQRIHKIELRSEFADWIRENYPKTRYVHIDPQANILTDECGVPLFRMS